MKITGGLLLSLMLAAGAAEAGTNLLRNASFETQGSAETNAYYWQRGNPDLYGGMWGTGRRTWWRHTSGDWSGAICGTWAGTNCGGFWQDAAVTPGRSYRFAGWFWADGPGNQWTYTNQGLRLAFYSAATGLLATTELTFDDIGENWVRKAHQAVAPSNAAWVRASIFANGAGGNGALQFDDFTLEEVAVLPGPSSRKTGVIISEIMYHPAAATQNLEYVELFNTQPAPQDLAGWRLDGNIQYTFAAGATLPALGFLVVAADPAAIQSVYGSTNVIGPWSGELGNAAGEVALYHPNGGRLLRVQYTDRAPWPAAADGAGHALALDRPSYGENAARAWSAGRLRGGSPGVPEPLFASALTNVVINEFLAHTDPPDVDFIELFNIGRETVDVSGCILTDDPATNKYRLPPGTTIGPRGFLVFDTNELPFALSAGGEMIVLKNSNDTFVIDAINFNAQANAVASGRYPDGAPEIAALLPPATPGTNNAPLLISDIVINEIMYNPISHSNDDEYIELYNRGAGAVDVGNWQFTAGITFTIPAGRSIAAGGYLVVARNAARLIATHTNLSAANTVGDYSGSLANSGERIVLAKPDDPAKPGQDLVLVDEVDYADGGVWGALADGNGSSLELKEPAADNRRAANWAPSDETNRVAWTTNTVTGVLDLGRLPGGTAIDQVHLLLMRAGECLVDEVEVIPSSGSTNLVINGNFEDGLVNVTAEGNHVRTVIETNLPAYSGSKCLHLRATGGGDTGANRVKMALSSALSVGATATIRCKARWLGGQPYLVARLRGNYLEAVVPLGVPTGGTPGARNSVAVTNAGPAIYDVRHAPALPAPGAAVQVSARVHDADGVGPVQLRYRVDPASTFTAVTMTNAGGGVWQAWIPGQTRNTLVAFHVTAADSNAVLTVTNRFPAGFPEQECLVRFGDMVMSFDLGAYVFWLTQTNLAIWTAREELSNESLDTTLVADGDRIIYNAGIRYRGSPFVRPWFLDPALGSNNAYQVEIPKDDQYLGADELNIDTLEPWKDPSLIRERTAFRIGADLGLPISHQRYVHLYLNGHQHIEANCDVQQVDSDYVECWFPDAEEGELFKIDDWFEFNSYAANDFVNTDADLGNYTTTGGAKKQARYRWIWEKKKNNYFDDDYSRLFQLADAANLSNAQYTATLAAIADMEQWMREIAFRHVVGDWDGIGYRRGKNTFAYKPDAGQWNLLLWDLDFALGADGGDSSTYDLWNVDTSVMPVVGRMIQHPPFKRYYWQTLETAAGAPLSADRVNLFIDCWAGALSSNGVMVGSPAAVKTWISERRNYIHQELRPATNLSLAITSNGGADFSTNRNLVTLAGRAPVNARTILINGMAYDLNWVTATNWTATIALAAGTNTLTITGYDASGQLMSNGTASIRITYTGADQAPETNVFITEIMHHPAAPNAAYIEIYNRSDSYAFDLQGWRLDGVGYVFGGGAVIPPGAYRVVAASAAGYAAAYTNVAALLGEYSETLGANGRYLRLVRVGPAVTSVVDEVFFEGALPWPPAANGGGCALQLVDINEDNNRVGNWAVSTNIPYTPGATNAVGRDLPPFPALWLNEIQPNNISGITNAYGRQPWLELFNGDGLFTNLAGFYLTDTYTNYLKWHLTAAAGCASQGFLVVWADAANYVTNGLHANFRLSATTGTLALVHSNAGEAVVLDYINHATIAADRSYGDYPDGVWTGRAVFFYPTPGATNNNASPAVRIYINEYMADNYSAIPNEDGNYADWFELFNAGTGAVDLAGYTLTDNLTAPKKYTIPSNMVIAAGGFRMVWADSRPGPSTNIHCTFALSKSGEALGIYAPDGTVVDALTFGAQTTDISEGRWWDGEPAIYRMTVPTPGAPNAYSTNNHAPTMDAITNRAVVEEALLSFPVSATDTDVPAQRLMFTLDAGAPTGALVRWDTGLFEWTPAEDQAPSTNLITVRVTDNGWPRLDAARTFTVIVRETNRAPVLLRVNDFTMNPGSLAEIRIGVTDGDIPQNALTFSLEPGAPAGAQITAAGGVFTWRPSDAQGGSTNPIGIRVVDDGEPPLGDTGLFTIVVSGTNVRFNADCLPGSAGGGAWSNFIVRWVSQSGALYRVQYQSRLGAEAWANLAGDITATGTMAIKEDETGLAATQRFYRVLHLLQ